jgi:hypothetical protein
MPQSLLTPIFIKTEDDMPWPDEPVFYLLTRDNLYLCRNHPYFRSCVPAPRFPTELAEHATSLHARFPAIPRAALERICSFFGYMSDHFGAEAIVLLAWDASQQRVSTIVPRQVATVRRSHWRADPIGVKYEMPTHLSDDVTIFCDIHSHCEIAAYASATDIHDEQSFAGLHIVVGRLHQEPPDFHAEAVVDGTRFSIPLRSVCEGYHQRSSTFPETWLRRIEVVDQATYTKLQFESEDRGPPPEVDKSSGKPTDAPRTANKDSKENPNHDGQPPK